MVSWRPCLLHHYSARYISCRQFCFVSSCTNQQIFISLLSNRSYSIFLGHQSMVFSFPETLIWLLRPCDADWTGVQILVEQQLGGVSFKMMHLYQGNERNKIMCQNLRLNLNIFRCPQLVLNRLVLLLAYRTWLPITTSNTFTFR